jgi:serine/threonine protein phosphatase PrpC
MDVAIGSQPGMWQRTSSDAHCSDVIVPGIALLAVADGFGIVRGTGIGSVALQLLRESLKRRVRGPDPASLRAALSAAFSAANARVYAQTGSHDDYVAGGTSLTAVLLTGDHAIVGHVGESRAYLARDGGLSLLTDDDSLAGDGWSSTRTTTTEAKYGSLLTRTLGTQSTLEASVLHVRLMAGDSLVLCTDGVHRHISGDEIAYALGGNDSASDVVSRLLTMRKMRSAGEGGTLIVGRQLSDLVPLVAGNSGAAFSPRNIVLALALIAVAALIAFAIAHVVFAP